MIRKVEAVYENGILRPLEPLALPESKHVKLIISDVSGSRSQLDTAIIERARTEAGASKNVPSIEEVRKSLSSIPGSMSKDVIAERGDY